MPNQNDKTPRLIRRGDVVMIKGTDQQDVVRGVQVVLQLANGQNDSYDSGEFVTMGVDTDITPAELVQAAQADASDRASKAQDEEAAVEAAPESSSPGAE